MIGITFKIEEELLDNEVDNVKKLRPRILPYDVILNLTIMNDYVFEIS
jgi:hypothetical protein